MVPVAKEDVPNLAVTSLVAMPSAPVAGQQMVVQCRVANPSREARRVSLTLDAGGSRQSQPLDLPAQGEAEAAFSVRCAASGLMPLTAEIDADGFPGDDRRHAVIRVRESLRLAIVAPEGDPAAATLTQVARAVPWLEAAPGATLEKLPPCELLFLPAWAGDDALQIRELAAKGTAVIVQPSPDCPASLVEALFGTAPGTQTLPVGLETSEQGWEATPAAEHPAFKLFAGGEFGNPLGGRFRQRARLATSPSATTMATFADGKPALLEATDRPLLLSYLSLDPAASTWPRESAFLPAVAEILLHLMPKQASGNFTVEPGGVIAWTNPSADASAMPVLEAPDGSRPEIHANGATWQANASAIPGIYRWLVSDQPVHLIAVPFPESESLLRPLDAPPSAGPSTAGNEVARRAALDQGLPLWPWLVAAALLFLLVEGIVAGLRPSPKPALN